MFDNLATRHACLKEMGVLQWYPRYRLQGAAFLHEHIVANLCSNSNTNSNLNHNVTSSQLNSEVPASSPVEKIKPEKQAPHSELGAANLLSTKLNVLEDNARVLAVQATESDNQVTDQGFQNEDLQAPEVALNEPEVALNELVNITLSTRAISLRCFRVRDCIVLTETEQGSSSVLELALLENILATCHFIGTAAGQNNLSAKGNASGSFNWPVFSAKSMVELQNANHEVIFKRWLDGQTKQAFNAFFFFGSGSSGHKTLSEKLVCEKHLPEKHLPEKQWSEKTPNQTSGELISFYAFEHSLADLLALPAKKADIWAFISSQNALVNH